MSFMHGAGNTAFDDREASETDTMPDNPRRADVTPGGEESSASPPRDTAEKSGFLDRLRTRNSRRDEEAKLREVYREHGGELFGLAYRSLGDRGLAEEIVQETFVRAWKSRGRFDERRGSARTWLFAITRNLITDAVRSRRARPSLASHGSQERAERFQGNDDPTERVSRDMLLGEALGKLREEHRVVLTEVHYRGRTYAELSEEMDVPVGTLRSRAFYGLKSLRLILQEMEFSDGR